MIPSEGIHALELRRTKLVDVYLYMPAAALTIAALALIVMDRRDRRAQLLSERETKKSEGKKGTRMPRWSLAERRRFVEIAAASKSLEELVDQTGRTTKGIRKMAIKLGITLPKATTRSKSERK
jgi:hypothetical protein